MGFTLREILHFFLEELLSELLFFSVGVGLVRFVRTHQIKTLLSPAEGAEQLHVALGQPRRVPGRRWRW